MQDLREKRPQWYSDEELLKLLLKRTKPGTEGDSRCIYMLLLARAMGRKIQVERGKEYSRRYLCEALTGEWIKRETPDCLEFVWTVEMEAVQIVGEDTEPKLQDGVPIQDHVALDQNDPDFFALCWENGLLQEQYLESYLEYAFEKRKYAVIPVITALKFRSAHVA